MSLLNAAICIHSVIVPESMLSHDARYDKPSGSQVARIVRYLILLRFTNTQINCKKLTDGRIMPKAHRNKNNDIKEVIGNQFDNAQ